MKILLLISAGLMIIPDGASTSKIDIHFKSNFDAGCGNTESKEPELSLKNLIDLHEANDSAGFHSAIRSGLDRIVSEVPSDQDLLESYESIIERRAPLYIIRNGYDQRQNMTSRVGSDFSSSEFSNRTFNIFDFGKLNTNGRSRTNYSHIVLIFGTNYYNGMVFYYHSEYLWNGQMFNWNSDLTGFHVRDNCFGGFEIGDRYSGTYKGTSSCQPGGPLYFLGNAWEMKDTNYVVNINGTGLAGRYDVNYDAYKTIPNVRMAARTTFSSESIKTGPILKLTAKGSSFVNSIQIPFITESEGTTSYNMDDPCEIGNMEAIFLTQYIVSGTSNTPNACIKPT